MVRSLKFAFEKNTYQMNKRELYLNYCQKKDKDITRLQNWRPISLLNTVYKLLAHVIANRMQKVLQSLISNDQNGYFKNTFIGVNIRTIYDIICH